MQRSKAPLKELAARHGLNHKTVAKCGATPAAGAGSLSRAVRSCAGGLSGGTGLADGRSLPERSGGLRGLLPCLREGAGALF